MEKERRGDRDNSIKEWKGRCEMRWEEEEMNKEGREKETGK